MCESRRDYARSLRRRPTDAERRLWFRLRAAHLEHLGYRILRFWNNDALGNTDGVLETIARALGFQKTDPSRRPSPQGGEGEGRR